MAIRVMTSPVGPLTLQSHGEAVCAVLFGRRGEPAEADTAVLRQCEEELAAYFAGKLRTFTVPLGPVGTPFQLSVWEALRQIPYGETRTYGEIAAAVGRPKAVRAVGQANHVNPLPIFIPCHRVVGKGGALTGYAGGLDLKRALLALESGKECL